MTANTPTAPASAASSWKNALVIRWIFCLSVTIFLVTMLTVFRVEPTPLPGNDGGFLSHVLESLFFLITLTIVTPLLVLLVIGIQPGGSGTGQGWTRPTFRDNPLRIMQPMHLMHLLAQTLMVMGAGILLSTIWNGVHFLPIGLMGFWFGVMIFVGLRICEKVYAKRMAGNSQD